MAFVVPHNLCSKKKKIKKGFAFLLFAPWFVCFCGEVTVSCSLYHIVGSHLVCWTVCCLWPPHLFPLFLFCCLLLCALPVIVRRVVSHPHLWRGRCVDVVVGWVCIGAMDGVDLVTVFSNIYGLLCMEWIVWLRLSLWFDDDDDDDDEWMTLHPF